MRQRTKDQPRMLEVEETDAEVIDTTLRYYVGRNAQRTAKILREAYDQARKSKRSRQEDGPRDTSRDTGETDSEAK